MWDLYKGKVYEKLAKMHKKKIFFIRVLTQINKDVILKIAYKVFP